MKPLDITLTEPVVFLRTSDPSGRHQSDSDDPPTLVRGILTLNVAKSIEISSIEVELTGVSTICYPEAIGSRRIDITENHKVYSSAVTIFRADQIPRARLSASVGPGLSSTNRNEDQAAFTSRLPSLPRGRSERRNVPPGAPLDLGPTPPYTAVQSPPIQSGLAVHGEHPIHTLEELRQTLRDNLGVQAGLVSPTYSSSIASPTTHSDAFNNSDDSLHPESDSHADDMAHAHTWLPLEDDALFHNVEGPSHVLPRQGSSSGRPTLTHSHENLNGPSLQSHGYNDTSSTRASRSRLRLSINSVLGAVREITSRAPSRSQSVARLEERERGRTRVRATTEEQSTASIPEFAEAVSSGNPNAHTEHQEHHLLGLGRVFGFERDHEGDEHKSEEHGENWREFKPGTYSYPISFLLPPHIPPTFSLPNGSLAYVIRGVAHRPGTFTSKLTCQVPLLVVSSPVIGTGEGGAPGDPGPLSVERQWQAKLAYSFGLSSRLFLLGSERRLRAAASEITNAESLVEVEARAEAAYGTATLDLTLLPIEKIKIWRLDLVVHQRVRYADERGRPCRDNDVKQVKLLALQDACSAEEMDLMDERDHTHKHKHKHRHDLRIPLLPTPISPHRSPLLQYLPPSTDPSVLAGPGPYTLSTNIGLPGCNDSTGDDSGPLHFTLTQKSSNVKVEHSLRLVMRVESVGEEDTHHTEGERKKLFDIAVQTPITILSCRCVPEYQMLPKYSRMTENSSQDSIACPCQPGTVVGQRHEHDVGSCSGHVVTSSPASSVNNMNGVADSHNGEDRSRPPSLAGRNGHASSLTSSLHLPSPVSWVREAGWNRSPSQRARSPQHHHAHSHPYSVSTSHVRTHSQAPSFSTPHPSRPPSPLTRYERLVSGLESEAGEAPPSYESVASSA